MSHIIVGSLILVPQAGGRSVQSCSWSIGEEWALWPGLRPECQAGEGSYLLINKGAIAFCHQALLWKVLHNLGMHLAWVSALRLVLIVSHHRSSFSSSLYGVCDSEGC